MSVRRTTDFITHQLIARSDPQIGKWRYGSTAVEFPNEIHQNPTKQRPSGENRGGSGWYARPRAKCGVRYRGLFYARCARPPLRPLRRAYCAPLYPHAGAGYVARGAGRALLASFPAPVPHYPHTPAPALRGRAVAAAYGRGLFCAVSGAARPRPLR